MVDTPSTSPDPKPVDLNRHRTTLIALMAFFFTVWFILPLIVPGARQIIYMVTLPFRHLGVFVHEMGHGLSAVVSGGNFHWFQMDLTTGGVAVTSGGIRGITLLGGLLGPAICGCVLLQVSTSHRNIRPAFYALLFFFCAGIYYMLKPLWLSRATYPALNQWSFGNLIAIAVPLGAGALTFLALKASENLQRFFLQVTGIFMCYAAYSDTSYIFRFEPLNNGLYSDARAFAGLIWPGGPEGLPFFLFIIVAGGISILNFGLLGWGAKRALREKTHKLPKNS